MIDSARKLALAEVLLSTDDLSACARFGLRWLARHTVVQRAVLAASAEDPGRLWGVSSIGVSPARTGEFSLDLSDRTHPLVAAAWGDAAVHFPADRDQPETPLEAVPFFALPLRADRTAPPGGLLLVEHELPALDPHVLWFAQTIGAKLACLRSRVPAQAGLDRERHLLYSIINAVTDPILLTDGAGKLIVGNARAEELFASRDFQSEGRRRAVELNNLFFSSALASRMVGSPPGSREVVLVDPEDGSDLLFELLTSPIDSVQEEGAVVSVLRNVTDLWRARQELEEQYRRLRVTEATMRAERNRLDLVVDAVGDPIIVTNPGGDILMTNRPAEHYFTVPPDAGPAAMLHVQNNVAQLSSFVAGLLLSGSERRQSSARVVLTDPADGRSVPMKAVAGTLLEEQGELTGVVTVLRDHTEALERERLYAELQQASAQLEQRVRDATAELAAQNELLRRQALDLEQASEAKSQFLANVSHEFRTPLNAILGYATMLLGGFYGSLSDEQQRTVARIDANSRHLATLINDVLDIERIEAGKMPIAIAAFGLEELMAELLEELEGVIAQSPAKVQLMLPPTPAIVRTDRQKLKQILGNLLTNALKFTQHGTIEIVATVDAARRCFSVAVRDTGIGISAADRARIFEPFQQAHRARSRALGGTGLGLAICQRLAEVLGGEIRVESELGIGSTFTVELPLRARGRAANRRIESSDRRWA